MNQFVQEKMKKQGKKVKMEKSWEIKSPVVLLFKEIYLNVSS